MFTTTDAPVPTIEAPYSGGTRMMDADSHIMEPPGWLEEYADKATRDKLHPLTLDGGKLLARMEEALELAKKRGEDPDAAAAAETEVLTARSYSSLGAWDPAERSRALDLFGFESQLVFGTFGKYRFLGLDHDVQVGGIRAVNRGMNAFCAEDDRLIGVATVPWMDPDTMLSLMGEALDGGAGAVLLPQTPVDSSPTHPDHDMLWSTLEERGVPFLLHIGGFDNMLDKTYLNNGHPTEDPFGENMRGKEYMAVHQRCEQFLSSMICDGVFDTHPNLMGGAIELTGLWVVPWLRRLDHCQEMWGKGDDTLARLELKASEYVHRNLFVTPFFGEPVGWMIEQAGEDIFMFSSDFPHPEGTTNPIGAFEDTMDGLSESARDSFYCGNYMKLMGMAS